MELNPTTKKTTSKPIDFKDIKPLVRKKINLQIGDKKIPDGNLLPHTKLVGIPTIEGMEFIDTEKIVRCEGLKKYTLIITTEKLDIISSYSLGKFEKLLEGLGFFSCHRSHLINLKFVKKYNKEGYIFFSVKSKPVPLARRRKCDFLNQIRHL